jgi:hypothetical protein
MALNKKNSWVATGCVLAIIASAVWIYYSEFKAPKYNVSLEQRIGAVMAEQTAKLVGPKGRLVLLTIPTSGDPELKTQLGAFRRALKKLGDYDLKEHEMDIKDEPKYHAGGGLSSRKFVRAVKNHPHADAIISFIGAPKLSEDEMAEIATRPKFIAESSSTEHLPDLFAKQILQVAVVSRFVFPAPGPHKPKTPQEWFDKRYQIVTASAVASIPASDQP